MDFAQSQRQRQEQVLSPQLQQGLRYLVLNLPDLRQELVRELSVNPVIESIESTLDRKTVSEHEDELASRERVSDYPEDDNTFDAAYLEGVRRGDFGYDSDALERREKLFENRTQGETLEEHLLAQLPFSDIPAEDRTLAELLIADLDDNGYYAGSIPDAAMVSGVTEDHVRAVLAAIRSLDPIGCGSLSHQECLLSQLDAIENPSLRRWVRQLVTDHWEDMAKGRLAAIADDLGLDKRQYAAALTALRTLDPRPGRAYRRNGHDVEYVNPEVHVVRCSDGYVAKVDARSLPEIKIASKYVNMLEDPATSPETKAYLREKIAAAQLIVEAVANRQKTIESIAQAIFDAQPAFFTQGLKGLVPMTMDDIAKTVGVHSTTVSRTVNGKYAATPKGTVELRRFFTSGVKTESGELVSRDSVLDRLRALVDGEDKTHPYSDDRLSALLKAEGFAVARRTVAKYRGQLKIPGTAERRST